MSEVDIYIETSLKAPRKGEGMYLYILEDPEHPGITKDNRGTMEIYEDATEEGLTLRAIKESVGRMKYPCHIYIHTPCRSVSAAFENKWTEKWKKRDWKTEKGCPVRNAEKWRRILSLLNAHDFEIVSAKQHIYSEWMRREMQAAEPGIRRNMKKGEAEKDAEGTEETRYESPA